MHANCERVRDDGSRDALNTARVFKVTLGAYKESLRNRSYTGVRNDTTGTYHDNDCKMRSYKRVAAAARSAQHRARIKDRVSQAA